MKAGLLLSVADLADRFFQRDVRVGVDGLLEADVAVGDLDKGEAAFVGFGAYQSAGTAARRR